MKKLLIILGASILTMGAFAHTCTDPFQKKTVRSSDEATIVYEYFHPAKLSEKKKLSRPITLVVDSLLANAKEKYEAENNTTSSDSRICAATKATPADYHDRAEFEIYRIKSWADSICNSFRRGSYHIGTEDAPR